MRYLACTVLTVTLLVCSSVVCLAADLGGRASSIFGPVTYLLPNPTVDGNPFDVSGPVTFRHARTGETVTTHWFYAPDLGDREDTWAFRFTGTKPGLWTFTTDSDDPDLAGHTGSVTVLPDADARGFLTGYGTKFARMIGSAENLKPQPYVVWMNQRASEEQVNPGFGYDNIAEDWGGPQNRQRRADYLAQARDHGAHAVFLHLKHEWFQAGASRGHEHDSTNPDVSVFAAIEDLIRDAHAQGLQVHVWAWGDRGRRQTPHDLPGGVNGEVDTRLQRYIADRLGPLPGWSIGYGFDLFEWTNQEEVGRWANHINQRSGWPHMMTARGMPIPGPDGALDSAPVNFVDSYASLIRGGQILHTDASQPRDDGGPDDYAEALEDVQNDPARPIHYEERHAYMRYWDRGDRAWPITTMQGTRRSFWWWTMAGGAGGWAGFYDGNVSRPGPYPNPEQLRTHHAFWDRYFALDMQPANPLSSGKPDASQGVAMANDDRSRIVLYIEDAHAIPAQLGGLDGSYQVTAVNTTEAYREIDLGTISASDQSIDLPGEADWAVLLQRVE